MKQAESRFRPIFIPAEWLLMELPDPTPMLALDLASRLIPLSALLLIGVFLAMRISGSCSLVCATETISPSCLSPVGHRESIPEQRGYTQRLLKFRVP